VAFKAFFLGLIKASGVTLKFLHLFNCEFVNNSVIIAIADNCKQLATFSMPCKSGPINAVTDPAFIKLAKQCPKLEVLYLGNFTSLTDAALTAVTEHCQRLRELTLCHIPKLTDASLLEVTACPHLTLLYVRDCPLVTAALMERVCSACPGLLELTMVCSGLVCQSGWTVNLNSLVALRLVGITLTEDLLEAITAQCGSLQELMLTNQSYVLTHDTDYTCIATNCLSLTELTLSACVCLTYNSIVSIFETCGHNLTLLELSELGSLDGEILTEIAKHCKQLRSLNLSGRCKFWGSYISILAVLKSCKQLRTLDLSEINFVSANCNWSKILNAMRKMSNFESLYLMNSKFAFGDLKEFKNVFRKSTKPFVYLKVDE
jgi:hypothetical protein